MGVVVSLFATGLKCIALTSDILPSPDYKLIYITTNTKKHIPDKILKNISSYLKIAGLSRTLAII